MGDKQTYSGTITKKLYLTHDVIEVTVTLVEPTTLDFVAGQFVTMEFPDTANAGKLVKRSYSIASVPEQKGALDFWIKLVNGGLASEWFRTAELGTALQMEGPQGKFVLDDKPRKEEMIFVGTGTGIAPLRSMVCHYLPLYPDTRAKVVFGVRHVKDVFGAEEMFELQKKYPHLSYEITLSRPELPQWAGSKGRVTDSLKTYRASGPGAEAFLCGSMDMIKEVRTALQAQGFDRKDVHFERFF